MILGGIEQPGTSLTAKTGTGLKGRQHNTAILMYSFANTDFTNRLGLKRPIADILKVGESKDSHKPPAETLSRE
jgi:hypothetical protein